MVSFEFQAYILDEGSMLMSANWLRFPGSSMHFDGCDLKIDTALEINGSEDMTAPDHPGLTVSCEEPLVPLVEEEARNVGRLQASVYWWVLFLPST
jgi:hypothetical protein